MKIYTKTGDKGTTSLVYGQRVSKTDLRVEAYGTCDEANSMLGLALSYLTHIQFEGKEEFDSTFKRIQTTLFHVGAELATPAGKEVKWKVSEEDVTFLETMIDKWDGQLPQLLKFILPGGSQAGASLHVARTIVRRAERRVVAIDEEVNPLVCSYLNRLSDFLFIAARYVNQKLGQEEPILHQ
ncbi:cob(I)yrinic acid a,c-diamide adenosyltransferase [Fredinandcohnia humi]